MASSRWPEDAAGDVDPEQADPEPNEWAGDRGLLGFVAVPDLPAGRHARPVERSRYGGRMLGVLSAAGLPVVAFGMALLASLMAGVSLVVGVVAISRVDHGTPVAAETTVLPSAPGPADQSAPPQAVVPEVPTTDPASLVFTPPGSTPVTPSASPLPTAPSPSLSPLLPLVPVYPDQVLRVARSTCDGTPVDLDQPQVFPLSGVDLAYRACDDGPHLDLDAAAGFAVVDLPTASAQDCRNAVRLTPSTGWLTPDPNLTACVLISPGTAAPQRLRQKLIRLHVDSIDPDGTLVLTLAAWAIPNP